jgi:hypothetical protein
MIRRLILVTAALILPTLAGHAEPRPAGPQVGETYEITRNSETSDQSSDGSTSSSTGRDTLIERVIALREDGLELEYDLSSEITAEERAGNWQFPARVFRPFRGPMQLLNRSELEARVERWLQAAGWTRDVCGRWIFTWNAFRIECDPQTVIQALELMDPGPGDLRDGDLFQDPDARGPAPLRRTAAGPGGATFVVEMSIDPDAVRRHLVESDVVVAEITGQDLTRDAALRARSSEDISGTITITLDTDPAGRVWRRAKVTVVEIRGPDGRSESRTGRETVERRRVAGPTS